MSSDNEPAWKLCEKAVWMLFQNSNNLADAEELLNRPEDPDLHIAFGKCLILLLTAVRTQKKTQLENAVAEFKLLEARCAAAETRGNGGWLRAAKRKLFPAAAAATVDDYDRRIVRADVAACTALSGLTLAALRDGLSVGSVARAVYELRRVWKMYQQCYVSVLDVYRGVYRLDQNDTPRWPPVLISGRQSFTSVPAWYIGSRMRRSATTSFENKDSNIMPNDVVRLMAAISLGYGVFNLCVSLLPPTVVSMARIFGFYGNHQTGLDALEFAKNGSDIHAPLAWGFLSWYRMMGNTDFLFDGPRSRENELSVHKAEQLILNPPEELRNSCIESVQYLTGRSCYLKGDLDGAIRAYELGATVSSHEELGFMYAIRLNWTAACKQFATVAGDFDRKSSYHYVLASACAGATGDTTTAELMWRRSNKTSGNAERYTANFVVDGKRTLASALLRTAEAGEDTERRWPCRLLVYEALYVRYGVTAWPADTLYAVLTDCQESENRQDDGTIRYAKKFLTIVCRKALEGGVSDDRYRNSLRKFVENVERDQRCNHLYAYGLYELAAEQISSSETVDEGKLTIKKFFNLKGPYHFQYFYEIRFLSLQAYVQRLNIR